MRPYCRAGLLLNEGRQRFTAFADVVSNHTDVFRNCRKDGQRVINWPLMRYRGQTPYKRPQIVRTACSKDVQMV